MAERTVEITAQTKWRMFVQLFKEQINKRIDQTTPQEPTFIMEFRNPLIGLTISPEVREGGTPHQQQLATLVCDAIRYVDLKHQFSKDQLIALKVCGDFMTSDTLSASILAALDNLMVCVGLDSLP